MGYILGNSNLGNGIMFSNVYGIPSVTRYITIPDAAFTFIDGATNNFSFSCWFTPTLVPGGGNQPALFHLPQRFEVLYTNSQLTIRASDSVSTIYWGTVYNYSNFFNINILNHLIVTFDRSNTTTGGKIYFNGNLVATFPGSPIFTNPVTQVNSCCIGQKLVNPGPNNFVGYQHHVAMFNRVLTQAEIDHLYQLEGDIPSTAKGNFRFGLSYNQKSGNSIPDISGNGNNGTCINFGSSTNLGQGAYVDSCTLLPITI